MGNKLNWGFLGTGWIADVCANDLEFTNVSKYGITARDLEKTKEFAASHGFANVYGTYEEMLADENIDVVYVATLNQFHHEHVIAALNAGKHVLLEKPFTINAAQAREVIALARSKNLFLLEAMWEPHLPKHKEIERVIAEGLIGEPVTVTADLSLFQLEEMGYARMWHRASGGGTLLDLGIYPLHFVSRLLGPKPESITAEAQLTVADSEEDRVDEDVTAILKFAGRKTGIIHSRMSAFGWNTATILGTQGRIEIPRNWWEIPEFTVLDNDNNLLFKYDTPLKGTGRQYQFLEVERCIKEGLTESPVLTLDHTLTIMESMDEIRRQIGVKYQWD